MWVISAAIMQSIFARSQTDVTSHSSKRHQSHCNSVTSHNSDQRWMENLQCNIKPIESHTIHKRFTIRLSGWAILIHTLSKLIFSMQYVNAGSCSSSPCMTIFTLFHRNNTTSKTMPPSGRISCTKKQLCHMNPHLKGLFYILLYLPDMRHTYRTEQTNRTVQSSH